MLYVDGKEVARNSLEHTTPVTFPEDETFDVGQDTRTGVALVEYRYDRAVQVHRQDHQADRQARPDEALVGVRAFRTGARAKRTRIASLKKVLGLAAVGEVATGVALLLAPSMVGRGLFGADLTGMAMVVARVTGIALIALGSPAGQVRRGSAC